MNMTSPSMSLHMTGFYRKKEGVVFASIPGMAELSMAHSDRERAGLYERYPDAAFAQMILDNLFCPDRELNGIYLRTYQAILNGEPISDLRIRFNKALDAYWERHMWDD